MDKVFFDTIEEYRNLFQKEFLDMEILSFDNIPVKFKMGHFDHIFFRNKDSKAKFDKRTAQSILKIKAMITWNMENTEMYEQFNPKSKRNERSHVLVYDWLFVILFKDEKKKVFFPITAYHKWIEEVKKFKQSMIHFQL